MEKLWLDQNFKPLPSLEHNSTFYSHIPPSKKAPNPYYVFLLLLVPQEK